MQVNPATNRLLERGRRDASLRNVRLRNKLRSFRVDQRYDNDRPVNIPGRLEGCTLLECMTHLHPHIGVEQWHQWFDQGRIIRDGRPMATSRRVRGGEQFHHRFPDTIEPPVDTTIRIVHEDDSVLVVDKPAPLPAHPSGRFNRNTLTALLRSVFDRRELRLVQRLDANTTGAMVLARTREAARCLGKQFESGTVGKSYLVRCHGHPSDDVFECDAAIGRDRDRAGTRDTCPNGRTAVTRFQLIARLADTTSLLEATPTTGRTNQIRIHLWSLGLPVCGDPSYLPGRKRAAAQTLLPNDPPMCLHSAHLSFKHPIIDDQITFAAPAPTWARRDGVGTPCDGGTRPQPTAAG